MDFEVPTNDKLSVKEGGLDCWARVRPSVSWGKKGLTLEFFERERFEYLVAHHS